MTDRLKLYRAALRHCGAGSIADLTEDAEGRRLLDEVWDDGGVRRTLSTGAYKFALRTQRMDYDPIITPDFGYRRAFEKPTDWVVTAAICTDEYFDSPLLRYEDEGGYIYTDEEELYVRFVSDDAAFGGDLSKWTEAFKDYAAAYFASQVIHRLTSDKERIQLLLGGDGSGTKTGYVVEALRTARAQDAMQGPPKFLPSGSWVRSRGNGRTGRGPMGDGGPPGSLVG